MSSPGRRQSNSGSIRSQMTPEIHSTEARPERIDINEKQHQEIAQLARRLSRTSQASAHSQSLPAASVADTKNSGNLPNPFAGSDDPRLAPSSGSFDIKAWIQATLQNKARDPDRYPTRTAGVSFRNLGAYGFGTSTDTQRTVTSVVLELGSLVRRAMGLERKRKIQILRNFDGLLKSGELLVVLGRPGSGCSTLLKTIAGETHGFHLEDDTQIHYQGIPREIMHRNFRGEVIYQAETDIHFPQLTVGETLSFAARARTPRNRPPGITREQWADHMRDVTMAILGISHTLNTPVGNDFVRGISGGERKRVSIAEVILSAAPLQCWDNSTRGLDSATALEFIKTLRTGSEASGATAIVAIYQASQSAYDLFDKVVVLYEGRQIYLGRTHEAVGNALRLGAGCRLQHMLASCL